MKALLVVVVALCFYNSQVSGRSGRECKGKDECNSGECCAIPPLFPIMSKRLAALPTQEPRTGYCMTYLTEGATCNPLSYLNGRDCGCGADLKCNFYPDKFGKRKLLPGRRICEKK